MRLNRIKFIFVPVLFLIWGWWFNNGLFHRMPDSFHAWSQIDRYALSLGFIDNGFDFFHPQTFTHHQQTINGITTVSQTTITAVDPPFQEYFIAALMKVTGGDKLLIFHLYNFLWSVAGLTALFLIAYHLSGSFLLSLALACFANLSPLFSFYQISFLPSVSALALFLIGFYLYLRSAGEAPTRRRMIALIIMSMAALYRATFLMPLFALFVTELIQKKHARRTLRDFALAAAPFFLYKIYNKFLAAKYGTTFLDQLMLAENKEELRFILKSVYDQWRFVYFSKAHWIFIAGSCVIVLSVLLIKKWRPVITSKVKMTFVFAVIWFFLCVLFSVAMMKQLVDHDYYFIDSFFVPAILLAVVFSSIISTLHRASSFAIIAILLVSLYPACLRAVAVKEQRYAYNEYDRTVPSVKNFSGADQLLNKNNIPDSARLLVFSPAAPNLPFVYTGRKGFAMLLNNPDMLNSALNWPFDYILYQNEYFINDIYTHDPQIGKRIIPIDSDGKLTLAKRNTSGNEASLSSLIAFGENLNMRNFNASVNDPHWGGLKENNAAFTVSTNEEWGPGFKDTIRTSQHTIRLIATAEFLSATDMKTDATLVCSVDSAGKNFYYQGLELFEFLRKKDQSNHVSVMYTVTLPDMKGKILSWYIWNKGFDTLALRNLKVQYY